MEKAVFSVIMPVYNAAGYLPRSLEKFAALGGAPHEIIFVDDGSDDGSTEMLASFCNGRSGAKLLSMPHGGVSAARNAGLSAAAGEYVLFLDADDNFLPRIFDSLCEHIEENGADILVFGAEVVNYDPNFTLSDIVPRNIVYRGFAPQALFNEAGSRPYVWNCAYRRQFLIDNKIAFDTSISLGEDQLFQFCAFPLAQVIEFFSEKLYRYNYLRYDSAMKKYLEDIFGRCMHHIELVDRIIRTVNIEGDMQVYMGRWLYDFLHKDILSLDNKRFSSVSRALRDMLRRNNIKISKMPIGIKKKLEFYSLYYTGLRILRKIFWK